MSSVTCNQTNTNTHLLFPTTITTATKMMNYSHIQPHPIAEDGETRKVPTQRSTPYTPETTQSVLRRNARERNRVKQVNNSFSRLRQHIPQSIIGDLTKGGGRGPQKKISKVDTLRIAVEYIRRLQDLLDDLNGGSSSSGTGTTQQQYDSRNTGNCDSASNSSFASSTCSSASYTTNTTPVYYTQSTSPLPASMEANIQQTQLNNSYNISTTLLSPVSLNSYSPPHLSTTQLDTNGCHSPTSSFNSSLSFDSGTFEQQQQPATTTASTHELSPQHYQQQQQQQQPPQQLHQQIIQTAAAHFDGNLQLKFEPYDNFNLDEEDCTPDDEEILDYISLWQEQ